MKKSSISRNIALLMEHFGIRNEAQLAKLLAMPQTTINKLITGTSADPRISTLTPITKHFNVSIDTLISEIPPTFTNDKKTDMFSSLIPLVSYIELLDVHSNLASLTTDNWPHWYPIIEQKNLNHYAVYLKSEQLPNPFNKESILILKNKSDLLINHYYILKHLCSNSIALKKVIFDSGIFWLIALQQNIPAAEYTKKEWQILGEIEAQLIDMSNGTFIHTGG